jgi:hypothetical protein
MRSHSLLMRHDLAHALAQEVPCTDGEARQHLPRNRYREPHKLRDREGVHTYVCTITAHPAVYIIYQSIYLSDVIVTYIHLQHVCCMYLWATIECAASMAGLKIVLLWMCRDLLHVGEGFEQDRYTRAIDQYQSAQINTQVRPKDTFKHTCGLYHKPCRCHIAFVIASSTQLALIVPLWAAEQVSLGILNITQAVLINATVFAALAICLLAIKDGSMDVGDFVSVMTYISQMFTPLGFLGTIYGAVIRSLVEM